MKTLFAGTVAVIVSLVSLPAFAGRDETQIRQQERAVAAQRAYDLGQVTASAQGPAADAQTAKAGQPATQIELLKRFHPKHAYGY